MKPWGSTNTASGSTTRCRSRKSATRSAGSSIRWRRPSPDAQGLLDRARRRHGRRRLCNLHGAWPVRADRQWRQAAVARRQRGCAGGAPPRQRNVVIEFESMAAALACHASPEYGAARAARTGAAEVEILIVEGLSE
ncbi:DUF1330 domain-containing protein [Sphingomonas sp. 22R3R2A-7]